MPSRGLEFPFPAPSAGVVVSENPLDVGAGGLMESVNVVDRNGVLMARDGLALSERLEETSTGQPVLGLISLDVQNYGVVDENRLHYLTDDAFRYKTSGAWYTASTQQEDWGTELVGPDATDTDVIFGQAYVSWKDTIQWGDIDTESGQDAKYLRIEIDYDATLDSWIGRLHTYYGSADPYSVDANTFIIGPTAMSATTVGTKYQFSDGSSEYSGVFIVWTNTDMTDIQFRTGNPLSGDAIYNQLIVRSTYGLPNKGNYFTGLDRDAMVQWAAWDYSQITHVIGAVGHDKGYVFEFHDGTGTPLSTYFKSCGPPDGCPKAETVAVAGQRLVAGNVSFIDSIETLDNIVWAELDSAIEFTNYPDGVVYSGTVLTGGHTVWYPTDIIRLADTPGQIRAIKAMGTMMIAVYKTDAIYILAVQSGITAFRPDLRATGIRGPVGRNAVAAIADNLHVYLAEDGGLYVFDGSAPRSLGEQFRAWIGREMDSDYMSRAYLHFDQFHNELHVYYPHKGSGGEVRRGLIVSMDKKPFRAWPIEYPAQGYNYVYDGVVNVDYTCMTHHWGSEPTRASDIMGHSWPSSGSPDSTDTSLYPQLLIGTQYSVGDAFLLRLEWGVDDGQGVIISPIHIKMRSGVFDLIPNRQKILLAIEWLFERVDGWIPTTLTARLYGGQTSQKMKLLETCTDNDLIDPPPYMSEFRHAARYFAYELEFDWYSVLPNMLPDSASLCLDASQWTIAPGGPTISDYTDEYRIGGACLQVDHGVDNASYAYNTDLVRVEPSTQYTLEVWVKNQDSSARNFSLRFLEYDATGVPYNPPTGYIKTTTAAAESVAAGSWERLTMTVTVTANTYYMLPAVSTPAQAAGWTYLIDALRLARTAESIGYGEPPTLGGLIAYVKRSGRRHQVQP